MLLRKFIFNTNSLRFSGKTILFLLFFAAKCNKITFSFVYNIGLLKIKEKTQMTKEKEVRLTQTCADTFDMPMTAGGAL